MPSPPGLSLADVVDVAGLGLLELAPTGDDGAVLVNLGEAPGYPALLNLNQRGGLGHSLVGHAVTAGGRLEVGLTLAAAVPAVPGPGELAGDLVDAHGAVDGPDNLLGGHEAPDGLDGVHHGLEDGLLLGLNLEAELLVLLAEFAGLTLQVAGVVAVGLDGVGVDSGFHNLFSFPGSCPYTISVYVCSGGVAGLGWGRYARPLKSGYLNTGMVRSCPG